MFRILIAVDGSELALDAVRHGVALVDAAGVPYETEIGLGAVAATLVDMVERCGCDLLFIGARGLGGLRGTLLGSVSQALVQQSPVPVTVVKHAEPEELPEDDDEVAQD